MSRGFILGLATTIILAWNSQIEGTDSFQLLGGTGNLADSVQTIGWPHRHHYHHHHHGHWHGGYGVRSSFYYPRYYAGYSSFGFGISIGGLNFSSYPSYPVYSPGCYAPGYLYAPVYSVPYYTPYSVGYGFYGANDAAPSISAPRTNAYVFAPTPDAADDLRLGVKRDNGGLSLPNAARQPEPRTVARPVDDLQRVVDNLRLSNATSQARARALLTQGDQLFAEQRFASALEKYKSAVAAAPNLPEAYFREGHAFVATNHFDLAAKAFKLAVLLAPDAAPPTVSLDVLYAGNQLTKRSRIEAVAQRALVNRDNADLLFLVGILLRSDGQPERAEKFFQRAAELTVGDDSHLRPFLPGQDASAVVAAIP